ncbi:uncharacterized protein LOC118763527 [Octopus sinensis]|uniref:Uncharacterized protein LOC118763527 n=1 Tax=Octopus sinensis TaxID=2607531 RepID=A0A7E6EW87_9MOLL|nr:uncharacterized protein LOC118763527 [Octopus sinensis]
MPQFFSNQLFLVLLSCFFIKKSYPISTKSRTYFAKVNEQIEIVYEFYYGEKLREWVVSGLTLGNCSFTRPLEDDSFKIDSISCEEKSSTLKLTLLANRRLTFLCYTNSCSATSFIVQPMHAGDGNKIESVSGTSKAFMNKNFTLICEIGNSPEVRWYIRSTGLLLAKFVNCEKVPGSIQRLHSPVRISCNLISQKSTLELGPVNLKDGNFTIVCATKHHGSEFKVSTIDSRNLTIHDAGTITVTGENIATLLCPLEEGDTLSVWKGNGTVIGNCTGGFRPVHTYYETMDLSCAPGGSILKLYLPSNTTELNVLCESQSKKRRVFKLIHKPSFRLENVIIIILVLILLLIIIANFVCFLTKPGREFCIQQALISTTNDPDFEIVSVFTEKSDASKNI